MNRRSRAQEIMDLGPEHYSQAEYEECLKKLFLIGKYTGIHRDTYQLLEKVRPRSILDVGCGDGAFLAELATRMPELECLGIDISADAIRYAGKRSLSNVHFSCTDKLKKADCLIANLVCHHMQDEELDAFLENAYYHANRLVLINDLQRHRVSKWLFRLISGPLFSNRLISNDGLVSIARGFYKAELEAHIAKLSPHAYQIVWRFPFRWQVLLWKR